MPTVRHFIGGELVELVAEIPPGGYKSSGHGKDLSMYGFEDYTRIKHVMVYTG